MGTRRRTSRRSEAKKGPATAVVVGAAIAFGLTGIVLAITSGGDDPESKPPTVAERVAAAESSICVLGDGFSSGSGFVVADGVVATNAHVVRRMFTDQIEVYFPPRDSEALPVTGILHEDLERDVCLLAVPSDKRPLPVSRRGEIPRGEELLVIGSPGLGADTLETAVARGLAGGIVDVRGLDWLQVSVSVNPGNSGGPILDPRGQVVGIVTLKSAKLDGVALGVPARALRAAVRAIVTDDDAATTRTAHHDAVAVFLRLRACTAVHLEVADNYLVAARIARSAGKDPSMGVEAVRRRVADQVRESNVSVRSVEAQWNTQDWASFLEPKTAARLHELTKVYHRARLLSSAPEPKLGEGYARRAASLREELTRLNAELAEQLGVERK